MQLFWEFSSPDIFLLELVNLTVCGHLSPPWSCAGGGLNLTVCVVTILDQPEFFYVAAMRYDLSPKAPFPSPELYSDFYTYYTSKYGLAITNTSQPLLDVDRTSGRSVTLGILVRRIVYTAFTLHRYLYTV